VGAVEWGGMGEEREKECWRKGERELTGISLL